MLVSDEISLSSSSSRVCGALPAMTHGNEATDKCSISGSVEIFCKTRSNAQATFANAFFVATYEKETALFFRSRDEIKMSHVLRCSTVTVEPGHYPSARLLPLPTSLLAGVLGGANDKAAIQVAAFYNEIADAYEGFVCV